MKRMKSSFVAWSLLSVICMFPILLYMLPYERFLDLSLATAFGVTFASTIRYGRDAISAFRSGRSGGEFLIVALCAIFTILLGQRVWGIVLRILDRPDWLVNSPITILVPYMLSWAIFLALIAPDIDLEPEEARAGIWKSVALFIGGALAGFVVAASFGVKGGIELSEYSAWPHLAHRASCKPSEPVWVSSNGVYHSANSPYRAQVIPSWCFSSTEEAEKRGFRAVRGSSSSK